MIGFFEDPLRILTNLGSQSHLFWGDSLLYGFLNNFELLLFAPEEQLVNRLFLLNSGDWRLLTEKRLALSSFWGHTVASIYYFFCHFVYFWFEGMALCFVNFMLLYYLELRVVFLKASVVKSRNTAHLLVLGIIERISLKQLL